MKSVVVSGRCLSPWGAWGGLLPYLPARHRRSAALSFPPFPNASRQTRSGASSQRSGGVLRGCFGRISNYRFVLIGGIRETNEPVGRLVAEKSRGPAESWGLSLSLCGSNRGLGSARPNCGQSSPRPERGRRRALEDGCPSARPAAAALKGVNPKGRPPVPARLRRRRLLCRGPRSLRGCGMVSEGWRSFTGCVNPRAAAACVWRAASPSLAPGFYSCWSAPGRRALLVSWPRLAPGTRAVFFRAVLGGGSAWLRRGAWLTRLSRTRGSRRSSLAPRPVSLLPFPWVSDLRRLAFLFLFLYFTFPPWRLVFPLPHPSVDPLHYFC